ncbi:MAG: type II toxin-antitoxin system VapC family toxin [Acidobacteriota bacterium]
MFALDANTLIYALKGLGRVQERMEDLDPGDLAIPAVVAYEIEVGTLCSNRPDARRRDVQRLFKALKILPFDARAAEQAARVRHRLERNGEKIGPLDTLIAGTALAFGATLVTRNTREFSRVQGLHIEDWF